jgi:hypothetical protein
MKKQKNKLRFSKSIPIMFVFSFNSLSSATSAFETLMDTGKKSNLRFTKQSRRKAK